METEANQDDLKMFWILETYYRLFREHVSVPFLLSELVPEIVNCQSGINECTACCALKKNLFLDAADLLKIPKQKQRDFLQLSVTECRNERLPWDRSSRLSSDCYEQRFSHDNMLMMLSRFFIICIFVKLNRECFGETDEFTTLSKVLKNIVSEKYTEKETKAIFHLVGGLQGETENEGWLVLLDQAWVLYKKDMNAHHHSIAFLPNIFPQKAFHRNETGYEFKAKAVSL